MSHNDFAARLRAESERQGLTLQQVGDRAGVHKSQVSRLERGMEPTLETARKVCAALGISLAEFDQRSSS